jgi:hypothetical protein
MLRFSHCMIFQRHHFRRGFPVFSNPDRQVIPGFCPSASTRNLGRDFPADSFTQLTGQNRVSLALALSIGVALWLPPTSSRQTLIVRQGSRVAKSFLGSEQALMELFSGSLVLGQPPAGSRVPRLTHYPGSNFIRTLTPAAAAPAPPGPK